MRQNSGAAAADIDRQLEARLAELSVLVGVAEGEADQFGGHQIATTLGLAKVDLRQRDCDDLAVAAQEKIQALVRGVELVTVHDVVLAGGAKDERFRLHIEGEERYRHISVIEYIYRDEGTARRALGGAEFETVARLASWVVEELMDT